MVFRVIDISDYQSGININNLTPKPDGVIVKVTQGSDYKNIYANGWGQAVLASEMSLGLYHYIDGSGVQEESDWFISNCKQFQGRATIFLDWEEGDNAAWGNEQYLLQLAREVKKQWGTPPIIYMSAETTRSQDHSILAQDYGLWFAQYANNDPVGWIDDPWNDGENLGAWGRTYLGQQYTDNLQIGWAGGLDGSIFKIDFMKSTGNPSDDDTNNGNTNQDVKKPKPPKTLQKDDPCMGMGLEGLMNMLQLHGVPMKGLYK